MTTLEGALWNETFQVRTGPGSTGSPLVTVNMLNSLQLLVFLGAGGFTGLVVLNGFGDAFLWSTSISISTAGPGPDGPEPLRVMATAATQISATITTKAITMRATRLFICPPSLRVRSGS